jgi:ABC-2 type transport system ATP-binding protein
MNFVIELEHATKTYGAKVALRDVTLRIEPGVTGLLGPNGSGKSSLIKSLLGLVTLNSGHGRVLGKVIPGEYRSIREEVGYLPEDDCFVAGLNGIEAVLLMARLAGLPDGEGLRRAHEMLDYADVGQERYRPVESYSTGMRQKLKFAQALVHDPQLIILDEPTNGLDPEQRSRMLHRISQLAKKHQKSVLLSTHILHDVRETCDSVIILSQGSVRVHDSLRNLSQPSRPGLQVRLRGDSQSFREMLEKQELMVESQVDGTLWIHGLRPEQSRTVWQAAAAAEISVETMLPATNSLEQVFLEAVMETRHGTV